MNTFVWRVAATVLVVAAGTLVVVRTGSFRARSSETEPVLTSVPSGNDTSTPSSAMADAAGAGAAAPSLEKSAATTKTARVPGTATNQTVGRAPAATSIGMNAPAQNESRVDRAGDNKPELLSRKTSVGEGNVVAAAPTPSVAPPVAAMAPQQFGAVAGGRVGGVAPTEDARDNWRIREIGPRRAIGEKQTLYEVAAGDTVVFAEELTAQLLSQSVVVTGAGVVQAPAQRGRAAAKVSTAAADTPRTAAAAAPAAAPPAERSFPVFTEAPNGVNTLTWKDSTTRTMVRLSGRHTRAELEEIRRRIDRMRATAPADSVRKTP